MNRVTCKCRGDRSGRPVQSLLPRYYGDNIICWRLGGDETGVCGMCIGGTNNRYWAGVIGPSVIGSGVVGPTVVGPGDQTGRPYIRVVNVPELRFDKMSNEGATMPFLAPKYDLVDSEGLLGRFAKYRLMQTGVLEQHFGGCWERMGVLFLFSVSNGSLFITF